jgi:cytidylate kinase
MSPPPPAGPPGDIVIVGPCASGKSTLVEGLRRHGLRARQIAQEHSYVPAMWQILARPKFLIYLQASHAACTARKRLDWTPREYQEQIDRLAHARQHCDFKLDTERLTPEEVLTAALAALDRAGIRGTV